MTAKNRRPLTQAEIDRVMAQRHVLPERVKSCECRFFGHRQDEPCPVIYRLNGERRTA